MPEVPGVEVPTAPTRIARRSFWLVFLVSLVVLFSPSTPSEAGIYGLDKVVHATLFAALAATTRGRFGRGLLLVLLYGPVGEVLQAVLPIHRDGSAFDALADISGALVGWWAVRPRTGEEPSS